MLLELVTGLSPTNQLIQAFEYTQQGTQGQIEQPQSSYNAPDVQGPLTPTVTSLWAFSERSPSLSEEIQINGLLWGFHRSTAIWDIKQDVRTPRHLNGGAIDTVPLTLDSRHRTSRTSHADHL